MKELFVPFDVAKLLEEKGFDEDCICGFNKFGLLISKVSYSSGRDCECIWGKDDIGTLRAPLYQQVVDWLDNKGFNINISSEYYYDGINWLWQIFWLNPISKWEKNVKDQYIRESIYDGTYLYGDNHEYPTRNDALLAAIKYVLTEKLT